MHRSGQTHKCTVVQLQGSDAEKHVYRLLDRKINAYTKFVELTKKYLTKIHFGIICYYIIRIERDMGGKVTLTDWQFTTHSSRNCLLSAQFKEQTES